MTLSRLRRFAGRSRSRKFRNDQAELLCRASPLRVLWPIIPLVGVIPIQAARAL